MTQSKASDTDKTNDTSTSAGKYENEDRQLRHFNARTIEEAVSLLAEYGEGARIIAGGVDVVGLMRNRVISPTDLVNIKTIPDLAYIKEDTEDLNVGALTTIKDIAASAIISKKYKSRK